MRIDTGKLIERYKDRLFALAFSICADSEEANDIVQETFICYHLNVMNYESEDHIRAWLVKVAANKAKNALRSFWKIRKVSVDDYLDTLYFESSEDRNLVEAVMRLPSRLRPVVHLFYMEGYSTKEISTILSISESNVRTRLHRARVNLKQMLKENWNDE